MTRTQISGTYRLRNQVLALEDDQITTAARRRISDRIAELEQEIADQQASLGKLRAVLDATPPDAPTVATCWTGCLSSVIGYGNSPSHGCGGCSTAWT